MKKLVLLLGALIYSFAYDIVSVKREYINVTKSYVANIYSPSQIMVATRVMGYIKQMNVDEGDFVRKGQVLFVVDPSDVYTMMDQAKGALIQAKSGLLMAEMAYQDAVKDYQRFKALYANGAVSKRDYEKMKLNMEMRKRQVDMAKGMLKRAQAAYEMAQNQLKYAKVKSPIDGIVVRRMKKLSEMAVPGYPVLVLSDIHNLKAKSFVNESDIDKFKIGKPVTLFVPALKRKIRAYVSNIVPSADPATHSYIVKYDFKETNGLLPGMYAKVYVKMSSKEAVLVPYAAITTRGGLMGVFVVEGGKVEFKPIKQIAQEGDYIAVEGLEGHERVILYPPVSLVDGQSL